MSVAQVYDPIRQSPPIYACVLVGSYQSYPLKSSTLRLVGWVGLVGGALWVWLVGRLLEGEQIVVGWVVGLVGGW